MQAHDCHWKQFHGKQSWTLSLSIFITPSYLTLTELNFTQDSDNQRREERMVLENKPVHAEIWGN